MPIPDLLERRGTCRLSRAKQAERAVIDPLDIRDKDSRIAGIPLWIGVGSKFVPAGESLLPRNGELRIVQRHVAANGGVVRMDPLQMNFAEAQNCSVVAGTDALQQFPCLFFLLFQIQDFLLQVPGPHDRRKRIVET